MHCNPTALYLLLWCVYIMNKELLKQCIIDNYQGVKEVDNGHGRGHWDKEDFTKDELSIIADEIIKDYENRLNAI